MEKKKIEAIKIIELCKKRLLFTGGCQRQYEKTFELAKNGITKNELAQILYVCSVQTLEEIKCWIEPLFEEIDWQCINCGNGFSDEVLSAEYMGSCVCSECVEKYYDVNEDGELTLKKQVLPTRMEVLNDL